MNLENIKKQYEIGKGILNKISGLNDSMLREYLVDLFTIQDETELVALVNDAPICKRILLNEKIDTIEFRYWDAIILTYEGISFQPEHGSRRLVIKFNELFNHNL